MHFKKLAKSLWIVLGVISSGGSKLFTTLHTIHLYYTHRFLVQKPQVPLVILGGD